MEKINRRITLPIGFEPPIEIAIGSFYLEALGPQHNERDFEALTSSKEDLRKVIDPDDFWPDEVLSLEDNLRDLTKDLQEFKDKKTFRYAIFNLDKSSYNGCFYIRPVTGLSKEQNYDCLIEFWFKSTKINLEEEFKENTKAWLYKDWGFKKIALPGREISWNEYRSL